MGGVLEAMIFIVGIIVVPANKQLFTMKMASYLYMASTKNPIDYFLRKRKDANKTTIDSLKFGKKRKIVEDCTEDLDIGKINELLNHHIITISYINRIKLYFKLIFCYSKKDKIIRLYEQSQ